MADLTVTPARADQLRWRRQHHNAARRRTLRRLILGSLLGYLPAIAHGQHTAGALRSGTDLPDAPGIGASLQATGGQTTSQATGSISGTVLDINGGPVPDAKVTLVDQSHTGERVVVSDSGGRFTFTDLPPGTFKFTITSAGLKTFVSSDILLHPGERREATQIALPLATANVDVQVTVTQAEIATEQIHLEEKQRVLGVFPNFYSSYIWNAAPLSSKQKFGLATKSLTDPVVFVATGVAAGIEQAANTFPGYGQGAQGYAKRYGAGYGDEAISRMLSSAILPSVLHQDPRYFYKGSGSKRSRAFYALSRALVTRGDNGQDQPNYSYVLGSFGAGAISNAYHPAGDRGVGLTLRNGFIALGGHAADNLLREFLFKRFTAQVPSYANGKP